MKIGKPTLSGQAYSSNLWVVVAVATVITVFCLISTKSLLAQAAYHRREIAAERKALNQINSNISAANNLVTQYKIFNGGVTNVIGGKNTSDQTAAPPDGTNARIVLDALPSHYDFPALVSSLSQMLQNDGLNNPGLSGADQSATVNGAPSPNPKPTTISISLTGSGSYAQVQKFIKDLERSIRPFDITSLQIGSSSGNISVSISMNTYFQPEKNLTVTKQEVK